MIRNEMIKSTWGTLRRYKLTFGYILSYCYQYLISISWDMKYWLLAKAYSLNSHITLILNTWPSVVSTPDTFYLYVIIQFFPLLNFAERQTGLWSLWGWHHSFLLAQIYNRGSGRSLFSSKNADDQGTELVHMH